MNTVPDLITVFEFSSFTVQPIDFRIIKLGHEVDVEPQVFDTLLILIEQRNRVVTKEELLEKIWHGRVVSHHVITRMIYQLRKILDNKSEGKSHIRTVRGKGYQFVAKVKESQKNNQVTSLNIANKHSSVRYWQQFKWLIGLFVLVVFGLINIQ